MPKFIASYGVHLGEPVWAAFVRDEAHDTADGERRYSLESDDAAVIAKLRKLKDYGITEVK